MDDTKADILMMFVLLDGSTLSGESTLQSAPGDEFMEGFKGVSSYDDYSNFFEVKNFSFSMKVEPQEQGVGKLSKTAPGQHPATAPRGGAPQGAAGAGAGMSASGGANGASNDPFDRWRSATTDQLDKIKYPVKFDTFSFDRIIDAASPVFFANCANQVKFKSATLVKRVSAGGGNQGDLAGILSQPEGVGGQSVGFLRFEFSGVMLTSLSWNDGDMVTENVEMTCDHMEVKYKRQKYEGKLEGAVPPAVWDRVTNGQPGGKQGT